MSFICLFIMLKIVLLAGLVWFGMVLFKRITRKPKGVKQNNKSSAQMMVACARCDIHIPQSQAVMSGGKIYCSEEHVA